MAQVKLSLHLLTRSEKIQLLRRVVLALTGNANYTTPIPALADVTQGGNALETGNATLDNLRLQAQQKTREVNGLENNVDTLLTRLAQYVELISEGNAEKILSSGFELRSEGEAIGALPAPQDFTVTTDDDPGELDAHWDVVRGAKLYVLEKCVGDSPNGPWSSAGHVTRSKITIEGLTSGSRVWLRVAAVGAEGQGAWSQPISKIVP